jgi:hypothetical protein
MFQGCRQVWVEGRGVQTISGVQATFATLVWAWTAIIRQDANTVAVAGTVYSNVHSPAAMMGMVAILRKGSRVSTVMSSAPWEPEDTRGSTWAGDSSTAGQVNE